MKIKTSITMLSIPILCSLPMISCVEHTLKNSEAISENKLTSVALQDFNAITNSNSNEVLFKRYVEDTNGVKYLVVVYKNGGYSLINKTTQVIQEVSPTSKMLNNYNDDKYELKYKGFGQFDYYKKERDCRSCGLKDSEKSPGNGKGRPTQPIEQPKDPWHRTGKMINAPYEVEHSWWFKLANGKKIGYTSGSWTSPYDPNTKDRRSSATPGYYSENGVCGYIGVGTLLMYNEIFKKAGYFNDFEYKNYVAQNKLEFYNRPSFSNIQNSFPDLNPQFLKNLYERTWFSQGIDRWWQLSQIVDAALTFKKGLNYEKVGQYSIFGDPFYWIEKRKQPLIFAGYYGATFDANGKLEGRPSAHIVTVYGAYNPTRFLCNLNWTSNEDNQLILNMDTYTHGMYFGLISNDGPSEKLRTYFEYKGKKYTGPEFGKVLSNLGMF